MNKKDKIIIIAIIASLVVVFLGFFGYDYYKKNNKTNNSKSSSNISTNVSIDTTDEDIDWSKYETKEISDTKDVSITKGGIYVLSGTINGTVTIDTDDDVKLILNGVTIKATNGPAIYVVNANNTVIYLTEKTTNTLEDSSSYSGYDEDVNGCIYSKDDLIFDGTGTLVVKANYLDGIVSKDDLKIINGNFKITSKDDGIRGKDSVYIIDGTFDIEASGDGIKATNDTDTDKGFVLIENGTFNITATNDGIQAETKLIIKDGTFNIKTTGNANTDSSKGLKAETLISISSGSFEIDTTDDTVHSNGDIIIDGGKFTIESDDDGIHADGMIEINNGTFDITAHEGIEATYVKINDGTINISAKDDGINAANKSSDYSVKVEINGGNITIVMGQGDTDGIDSNGDLVINGGTINITGQSPFDYDGTAEYNGGTLIVNGSETTEITNQFMGGGMMGGNIEPGNMPNASGGITPHDMQDGNKEGNRGQRGTNRR